MTVDANNGITPGGASLPYNWVIFDGDDTLWQTTALYDSVRREFCEWLHSLLVSRGLTAASVTDISTFQQERDKELYKFLRYSASRFPRSFEVTARHFLAVLPDDELNQVLLDARQRGERVFYRKAIPYPAAEKLLRSLKSHGVRLGLLTAGDAWVQERRIQGFPFRGLLDWVRVTTEEDWVPGDVHPKQTELQRLQQRYNIPTDRCLFVGDSIRSDVIPALKAGIDAVWIAHANWDHEQDHRSRTVQKNAEDLANTVTDEGLDSARARFIESLERLPSLLALSAPREPNSSTEHPPLYAYACFEGGGAKGLAHLGAVKACEARNIKFMGIAGTSAGSIVAGLLVAGYTVDELFNGNGGVLRHLEYPDIIGRCAWNAGKAIKLHTSQLFGRSAVFGIYGLFRKSRWIVQAIRHKGLLSTELFRTWYNEKLSEKLFPGEPVRDVTFSMIQNAFNKNLAPLIESRPDIKKLQIQNGCPLKIVATNVTGQAVAVYPDDGDTDMVVADAVSASIAMPFVFQPKEFGLAGVLDRHVDGGALSNFPVWSLRNRSGRFGDVVPLLGFRLSEVSKSIHKNNFLGYLGQIVATVVSGSARLSIRGVDDLHEINLPVSVSPLNFEMSDAERQKTFSEGEEAARRYFTFALSLVTQEQMEPLLAKIHAECLSKFQLADAHLRVNVITKRPPAGTLHVRYRYNMEFDTDDHLEFEDDGGGGVGRALAAGQTQVIDLNEARYVFQTYKMSKYEQAMIRPTLTSLLCVPIFNPRDISEPDLTRKEKLGVLNFDSDDDLLPLFETEVFQSWASEKAVDVALSWIALAYSGKLPTE